MEDQPYTQQNAEPRKKSAFSQVLAAFVLAGVIIASSIAYSRYQQRVGGGSAISPAASPSVGQTWYATEADLAKLIQEKKSFDIPDMRSRESVAVSRVPDEIYAVIDAEAVESISAEEVIFTDNKTGWRITAVEPLRQEYVWYRQQQALRLLNEGWELIGGRARDGHHYLEMKRGAHSMVLWALVRASAQGDTVAVTITVLPR